MTRVIYSALGMKVSRPSRFAVEVYEDQEWVEVAAFKKAKKAVRAADLFAYLYPDVQVVDRKRT